MSSHGMPTAFAAPSDCKHKWEPISMVFETQLLDERGRVSVRQPDLQEGRVYFICRECACHTYMTTQWLGARMYGSEDTLRGDGSQATDVDAYSRRAWTLAEEQDEEKA